MQSFRVPREENFLYEAIIAGTKVVTTDSTGDMKLHITSECGTVVLKKD